VIDIHCHILAEVDDGPKSWEVSREMCRMAAADGIEHIVATPHANDRYHYDRQYLTSLLDYLRQLSGGQPGLSLGCDFHLSHQNLQDVMVQPEKYLIAGSRYMLVELSNYSVPPRVNDSFTQLAELGITPVVTHPERNPVLQGNPERVLRWVAAGSVVQVTASVLTGSWGEAARRTAEWLLKREAVHVLATDAHDIKHRIPVLSAARDAVAGVYGADVARALVDDNPRAIIHNQPLPYFPDPVARGS
jgi:protein-tyrosine phosphatase